MADIDTSLVGSVINALPLNKMIATPLRAMIDAQIMASKGYADFIMGIGIKDGKAVMIEFDYDETILNADGSLAGVQQKKMKIPLLAAVTHPNICIDEGTVDFELTVSQSFESHTTDEASGSFDAKMGWGPFSVKVHGQASHKSDQTRKTDTRAKYSIHTSIKKEPPPEAIMRVIDFLTDAATKPTKLPSQAQEGPDQISRNSAALPDAPPATP